MDKNFAIQLFENRQVRVVWDAEKEKYYFSVVDVVQVLTESSNPQTYWRVLKKDFVTRAMKALQIVTL